MASVVALGSAPAYRKEVVVSSLWYVNGVYDPGMRPVLAVSGYLVAI